MNVPEKGEGSSLKNEDEETLEFSPVALEFFEYFASILAGG